MAALPDRLVLLAVAHDELEANVWRDVLALESIGIFVKSGDPLATFGVAPRPGSLRVFVRASDEKRARWFLGDGAGAEE
jgi:hypothetical protein